jgi:beta-lactam-binding protein with PASTA domain
VKKRSAHVVVLAVLSLLLLGPVPNSLARPGGAPRLEAKRAVPKAIAVGETESAGYATGTVIHADALRAAGNSLLGLDVSFSGSAWSSIAPVGDVVNEVNRKVAPKLLDKRSFGRGTALELGIGAEPQALIGQLSSAAAPASTNLVEKVIGPIGIPGIIRADLLRSQAQAKAVTGGCVFGPDKGYGLGSVLNLEVLGGLIAATNARHPYREVLQSSSSTRIVKGSTPGRLGLKSETRQTVAPVTFFKGTPMQFTIEVLGEWALRAVADGTKGSVHYGPLNSHPQTPIVRILNAKGDPIAQLTTQMLLTNQGLRIVLDGIAEISVGEPPRNIGDYSKTGALVEDAAVAAAVDVVRVRLLEGQLADVRIGHMEAAVTVPDNGVQCPGLKIDHVVDDDPVQAGDDFIYTIKITNPHDCVLKTVRVVESPGAAQGDVEFEVVSVDGVGFVSDDKTKATFPDIGPIGPGESKTVKVKVKSPGDSPPGVLEAVAVVTGLCPAELQPSIDPDGPMNPGSPNTPDIPVSGEKTATGPTVEVPPTALVEQPTCTVPPLIGKTVDEIKGPLEAAGCKLGDVTNDPNGKPEDAGKITDSNPDEGDKVPIGTEVDLIISPPACTVPNLSGMTEAEAKAALEKAGCRLGDVTIGPDSPDPGKVTEQDKPGGSLQPAGTDIDVKLSGPVCTIPNLVGMSEADARAAVEAQGCTLRTDTRPTSEPSEIGKVTTQNPAANLHLPKGSPVDVTLGVQVLGETEVKSQAQEAGTAPALVRTGGVALGGVALWLLFAGLATRLAGSNRLWQLVRRRKG